jgi:hypothetical protein
VLQINEPFTTYSTLSVILREDLSDEIDEMMSHNSEWQIGTTLVFLEVQKMLNEISKNLTDFREKEPLKQQKV